MYLYVCMNNFINCMSAKKLPTELFSFAKGFNNYRAVALNLLLDFLDNIPKQLPSVLLLFRCYSVCNI